MTPISSSSRPWSTVEQTLRACSVAALDPTTRRTDSGWWRATLTPDGPGTLQLRPSANGLEARGFGPGGAWLEYRAGALCGLDDDSPSLSGRNPVVDHALRRVALPQFGRTHTPYHDILPVILAQRITAREASRQWRMLCERLGTRAPGPLADLRVPPAPEVMAELPSWRLHPLGIERSRSDALKTAARYAERLHGLDADDPSAARRWLELLPGIGPWTSAHVAQISWGDPDAVIVGDYWLPHLVCRALGDRHRGHDAMMLELLEPWSGHRARIVRLLVAAGHRVERRAPGRRVIPIHDG